MRVAIGSDHAGFTLKEAVKTLLAAEHHDVIDVGTCSQDPVDDPDSAQGVGAAVRESRAERGIFLCGSGVGASMVANRVPGIRAGLWHDTDSAHQGGEHDDMNVLVLEGSVVGIELAYELIRAFLNARFTGEPRHGGRLITPTTLENRLRALEAFGQSVWLDSIGRRLIISGELGRLIAEDGLRGVTSNPAIFEKAVAGSSDYRQLLEAPSARALDAKTLYERLAVRDVQDACDALRRVYEETDRRDGYVSLEVSPFLAHQTAGTLNEARRLWSTVGRENLMIKVPATAEGIPAVEQLIAEGINVNVTLLFALETYDRVADAYITGLEKLMARGGDPTRVASVASFFVSRIDAAIDALIATRLQATTNASEQKLLGGLTGRVAIANAKLAYQRYQEIFSGRRWQALAAQGAGTQRLLWASTGTKNPSYRDVMYVEDLIGPDTVNTIPPVTLEAFRDHGRPRASLTEDVEAARDTMDALAHAGISMADVTDKLLADGVRHFEDSFTKLLAAVEKQSKGADKVNALTYTLPEPLAAAVNQTLAEWHTQGKVRRLWGGDASLWTGKDEAHWLGWLGVTNDQLAHVERLADLARTVRSAGFSHVLLLGMGGSSLGPEVMKKTFGRINGFPELHVLDSTDPAQVQTFENRIDLKNTLFIVSSKSGSTLEPNILKQYFFDRVAQLLGKETAGRRFVAITDPGSKLQQVAESDGFRSVFLGRPDIGGRYSVLSNFGLVPAAIMGVDVAKLLDRTEAMVSVCKPSVPVYENPGVVLGAILGVAARDFGREKVTVIASPGLSDLGAWLEQLLAESTGKEGTGLIPIDREPLGTPGVYGDDRLFVHLRMTSAPDPAGDRAVAELERVGHPVVRIAVGDPHNLGEEFFRWEFATAVAGSILGIHPFDQPDVEASKSVTRKLTAEYERTGALPAEASIFTGDGISLFTDLKNAKALTGALNGEPTLAGYLTAHLNRLGAGDYLALLAYIEMNEANERMLQAMRVAVRDVMRVATCLGFGPRFLHSTGQAYKGGPNTGVFLHITCDDAVDVPVPGQRYTFGVVKAAQARGDFQVLVERDRRALRVHLGADVAAGLGTLLRAITAALEGRGRPASAEAPGRLPSNRLGLQRPEAAVAAPTAQFPKRFRRELRVRYPPGKGRVVLRTELDWDRSLEPMSVSDDGATSTFVLESCRSFLYFKPCLEPGDGRLIWSVGSNMLALMTVEEVNDVYPCFTGTQKGSFAPLVELDSTILGRRHRLRIYLPAGYAENTLRNYPVFYMQDGRNLFFPQDAFGGRDWQVGESLGLLDAMSAVDRAIVVGIDCGDRLAEYTRPGYVDYARSVVEEIRPELLRRFRILDSPSETGVIGSSLGGVVSFYMAYQYPHVFGYAACMSSTFTHRDDLIDRVLAEPKSPAKFYLDSGWPGDNYEVTLAMAMALFQRGYRLPEDFLHLVFPLDAHDERAWGKRLHVPVQLAFGKPGMARRGRFV